MTPEPAKINAGWYSSRTDEWETPQAFFDKLHAEFRFHLDVCATEQNAKLAQFYTAQHDGLRLGWAPNTCWLNPPYSNTAEWLTKAVNEVELGATVVALVPARTDTRWWHHAFQRVDEVRFLAGRLKFGEGKNSAPFPSAVLVFRPNALRHLPRVVCWNWKEPNMKADIP